jgi:hypothetical protein
MSVRSGRLRSEAKTSLVGRLLSAVAVLGALGALGVFLWVVARRIAYPYDLEWMEGGMLCHALRLLQGQGIYVPPSVDFIPHLYTPGYPLLLAGIGKLTGDVTYLTARLCSTLSFLGALGLGGYLAWREGGSRAAALCALALPVATFPQTGGFFDLARSDSLQLFLTVLGAALAWYGQKSHARMALGAVILVLGFFTKQTAAPLIAVIGVTLLVLVPRRGPVLTFAAVGVVSFGLLVLWQNRTSDGWFWTYIFRLHQGHAFFTRRAFIETPRILFGLLGAGALLIPWAAIAYATGRPSEVQGRGLLFLFALALGGFGASCIGFGTQWAHTNAYIPGVFFLAIAMGAAAGRLLKRPAARPVLTSALRRARALREGLVLGLLLASLVPQLVRLRPQAHVPSAADRAAGDAVIQILREAPGEVLIPFHPFYAHLAGKRTYLHRMGVWDVRGTIAGPVRGLYAAILERRFARIIFDEKVEYTWADWPDVLTHYRITQRIVGPRTFEGADTRPGLVLEPVPPPAAAPEREP